MTLLRTDGLSMHFYGVMALNDVDITVERGDIVGVIGPNGSGKSTMFNCITGVLKPTSGQVFFNDEDITGLAPEHCFARGMSRTFQLPHVFDEMTVTENFILSIQESKRSLIGRLFRHREDEERERAEEVLDLLRMTHVAHLPAKNLSYGQKKLCDLGMALMSKPDVIMLDEPMAGVNPALIDDMVSHIRRLNEAGNTFVLVEHNLKVTMNLCPRVIVLDEGRKIAEGTPAEIQGNEQVVAAYFGG